MNKIKIGDRVSLHEIVRGGPYTRYGVVIDEYADKTRYRVRWDNGRLRTWIKATRLVNLTPDL